MTEYYWNVQYPVHDQLMFKNGYTEIYEKVYLNEI